MSAQRLPWHELSHLFKLRGKMAWDNNECTSSLSEGERRKLHAYRSRLGLEQGESPRGTISQALFRDVHLSGRHIICCSSFSYSTPTFEPSVAERSLLLTEVQGMCSYTSLLLIKKTTPSVHEWYGRERPGRVYRRNPVQPLASQGQARSTVKTSCQRLPHRWTCDLWSTVRTRLPCTWIKYS